MSVNLITNLPLEISALEIVPELNDRDTLSLVYASMGCYRIVYVSSKLKQIDFNLKDKLVRIKFEEDHLKSLLLLKKKIQKFKNDRLLFTSLGVTRSFVATSLSRNFKNDICCLCSYAIENQRLGNVLPIILFDFSKRTLGGNLLDDALEKATDDITKENRRISSKLTRAIMMHPNSYQITSTYLADALTNVIKTGDQTLIPSFIHHPKMLDVPGECFAGILDAAIIKNRVSLVQTLLDLPNATVIPRYNFLQILTKTVEAKNGEILQILLQHAITGILFDDETVNNLRSASHDFDLLESLLLSLTLTNLWI